MAIQTRTIDDQLETPKIDDNVERAVLFALAVAPFVASACAAISICSNRAEISLKDGRC